MKKVCSPEKTPRGVGMPNRRFAGGSLGQTWFGRVLS
jgi:hypothetical protein